MFFNNNGGYTLGFIYTNQRAKKEANNGQIGDLNPFWVGTRLLYIETLFEYMQ